MSAQTVSKIRRSEAVAGNIRAEAARRGLNGVKLARLLGLSQSSVSERMRGVKPWTVDEIDQVAEVFGIDPVELWALRGSNPEPMVSESPLDRAAERWGVAA